MGCCASARRNSAELAFVWVRRAEAQQSCRSSEQTPPEARAVFQGYNASSVMFDIPVKPKRDALDDWRVSALACDLKVIPARTE